MFIDNKYKKWYFSIINNAKNRNLSELIYVEKHHIFPKSIGGDNTIENIVKLTAKEHYICHLLLVKMTTGHDQYKMIHAAHSFIRWTTRKHQRELIISSKMYSYLKQQRSEKMKQQWKNDHSYRTAALSGFKTLCLNEEHKQNMQRIRKELWATPEYREKMYNRSKSYKKVIINGVIYNSLQDAGTAYNITSNNVCKRCKSTSKQFQDWMYLNE